MGLPVCVTVSTTGNILTKIEHCGFACLCTVSATDVFQTKIEQCGFACLCTVSATSIFQIKMEHCGFACLCYCLCNWHFSDKDRTLDLPVSVTGSLLTKIELWVCLLCDCLCDWQLLR